MCSLSICIFINLVLSFQASNLHKLATEKETRFREEQKANVRKEELKEKIMAFSEAEKEVSGV